ncbi:MAG: prepilin peptidase [bacterium]
MWILIFIIGLCIGSFLNVVILRFKKGENFVKGRSHCPKCKHTLLWYDNIPLVSYLSLAGKCRYCDKKISIQYPLVELATAVLFVLAFIQWNFYFTANYQLPIINYLILFTYFLFTAILIIIFVYDFRWYLILDKVSLPAIAIAFILNMIIGYKFTDLFLGGVIAGGFFLLQFVVSRGKWIGGGDIRLGFLIGVMLGWQKTIVALFIAYVAGAIIGFFSMIIKNKKMNSKVPFGTFLSSAAYISMLWGSEIMAWYMRLIR